jgi:arylsulfatase A-like enzyme
MSGFSAKNYVTARFGKAIIFLTILCAIFSGYWIWNVMAGRAVERSNLLLITLDTCRKDHLSVYGYGRDTSPGLVSLAGDGFAFENVFTVATNSLPSHATMMTGLYPFQHGAITNGAKLDLAVPTLAEFLVDRGYNTAGFVGYYALGAESGLNQGFEDFQFNKVESHNHDKKELKDDVKGFVAALNWIRDWQEGNKTIEGKKAGKKSNFFVWLHVQNIHGSYDPPPPYDSLFMKISKPGQLSGFPEGFRAYCANDLTDAWRSGVLPEKYQKEATALYDGEIRLADDYLSKIFSYLKESGLYEKTLIVATADHGEVFFEKVAKNFSKNGPGHTGRYNDVSIRVPLIIKPAKSSELNVGKRPSQLISTLDIAPTLMESLGFRVPSWVSGKSFRNVMKNENLKEINSEIYFQETPLKNTTYIGVRNASFKLVVKKVLRNTHYLLIDVKNDPKELEPLVLENNSQVNDLKSKLDKFQARFKDFNPNKMGKMSQKMMKALKDGGYIRNEADL